MKIKLYLALFGSLLTFCVGYEIGENRRMREAYVLCEPVVVLRSTPEKTLLKDSCGKYITY